MQSSVSCMEASERLGFKVLLSVEMTFDPFRLFSATCRCIVMGFLMCRGLGWTRTICADHGIHLVVLFRWMQFSSCRYFYNGMFSSSLDPPYVPLLPPLHAPPQAAVGQPLLVPAPAGSPIYQVSLNP